MTGIAQLHSELIARVLGSAGTAPMELRRAAFDDADVDEPMHTLIATVAHHADRLTDDDVAAVRAAGLDEDQIFEIVVCAAIGHADRQYKSALAALATATSATGGGR